MLKMGPAWNPDFEMRIMLMLGPKLWTKTQLSIQVGYYVVDDMGCNLVLSGDFLLHVVDCRM
jgi:hypothetical protein